MALYNDFTPDEVQSRKPIDLLAELISSLTGESELPSSVQQVNALVHRINTLGTIRLPVVQLDLETEWSNFRARGRSC